MYVGFYAKHELKREIVDHPPAKKVDFFQTKCKKYSACPEKPFFSILFHLYSNEIFIKKREKSLLPFYKWSGCGAGEVDPTHN